VTRPGGLCRLLEKPPPTAPGHKQRSATACITSSSTVLNRGHSRGFYSALLKHPITHASDDFVVVAANDTTSGLAFQLARDHRSPTWPDTAVPQQMHLDIMV